MLSHEDWNKLLNFAGFILFLLAAYLGSGRDLIITACIAVVFVGWRLVTAYSKIDELEASVLRLQECVYDNQVLNRWKETSKNFNRLISVMHDGQIQVGDSGKKIQECFERNNIKEATGSLASIVDGVDYFAGGKKFNHSKNHEVGFYRYDTTLREEIARLIFREQKLVAIKSKNIDSYTRGIIRNLRKG